MKKILVIFGSVILILTGCSQEDKIKIRDAPGVSNINTVLPEKNKSLFLKRLEKIKNWDIDSVDLNSKSNKDDKENRYYSLKVNEKQGDSNVYKEYAYIPKSLEKEATLRISDSTRKTLMISDEKGTIRYTGIGTKEIINAYPRGIEEEYKEKIIEVVEEILTYYNYVSEDSYYFVRMRNDYLDGEMKISNPNAYKDLVLKNISSKDREKSNIIGLTIKIGIADIDKGNYELKLSIKYIYRDKEGKKVDGEKNVFLTIDRNLRLLFERNRNFSNEEFEEIIFGDKRK